jgi:hypothetical protein
MNLELDILWVSIISHLVRDQRLTRSQAQVSNPFVFNTMEV